MIEIDGHTIQKIQTFKFCSLKNWLNDNYKSKVPSQLHYINSTKSAMVTLTVDQIYHSPTSTHKGLGQFCLVVFHLLSPILVTDEEFAQNEIATLLWLVGYLNLPGIFPKSLYLTACTFSRGPIFLLFTSSVKFSAISKSTIALLSPSSKNLLDQYSLEIPLNLPMLSSFWPIFHQVYSLKLY